MTDALAWPPTKQDLERLYLVERLSAAKIAKAYGLKYKNPKVGESTVLYHLKRNGIERRDPAEHVRKVTEEMVDEWVVRYLTGESLKRIAEDLVDPVTVWNHLTARGLVLRDKVEAQIKAVAKHERRPFSGDAIEKAYLMGLRYGDLDAVKHGRAVRVRVSTTHPAFADLFESLFSPFGFVRKYPRVAKVTGHEWNLECDLDSSFSFLLRKMSPSELDRLSRREFLAFLAGFFDAEGSIYFHKKNGRGSFELSLVNTSREVLEYVFENLVQLGLRPNFQLKGTGGTRPSNDDNIVSLLPQWRISIWRFSDVKRFLELTPTRHPEKTAKARIALQLGFRPESHQRYVVLEIWGKLCTEINHQVTDYVRRAADELKSRGLSL